MMPSNEAWNLTRSEAFNIFTKSMFRLVVVNLHNFLGSILSQELHGESTLTFSG